LEEDLLEEQNFITRQFSNGEQYAMTHGFHHWELMKMFFVSIWVFHIITHHSHPLLLQIMQTLSKNGKYLDKPTWTM
jgi:hypothetical protein